MFCEHCGNKIDGLHKFCTKCGHSTIQTEKKTPAIKQPISSLNETWWQRLLKVAYIILYLPLILIVPLVWSENSSSGGYYSRQDTYGEAFWYSLLTLVIYMAVARLIKIAVLYIAMGQKPEWKKEFKKFF